MKALEIDGIDQIEVIVFIITDLINTPLVDDYHSAETRVIETIEYFLNFYLFPVVFILALQ